MYCPLGVLIAIALAAGSEPIPVEGLARASGTLTVIGRYQEFLDKRFHLHGSPVSFILEDEAHARIVLGLTAGKDNLVVVGRFIEDARFLVESVERAPSDVEILAKRAEGTTGGTALIALGAAARERAERFEDEPLMAAAKDILRRGFEAMQRETPSGDLAGHLAWLEQMVSLLGDTKWALAECNALLARRPGWKEVERLLAALDCVPWRGSWLTREEFLKAQGLIADAGGWRLPDEVHFEQGLVQIARIRQEHRILRTHTDDYYRMRAEQGRLLPGMTRQEAVTAGGFPDHVRRIRTEQGSVDQWRLGNRYVYLLDDTVAIVPAE